MNLRFEWDRKKAASNLSRHRVSFEEALTVFSDPLARIFDDEDHSVEERREIIIGHSSQRRLLVVCFTAQGGRLEFSVREQRQEESGRIMKKTSRARRIRREEMRREHQFDYRKSRPNRFAPLMKGGTVAVVLDPDVASVFRSPEAVNSLLRSVINALPKHAKA